MLTVLERLKDRLWIPHQVGLEFHRRREDVIRVQLGVFDKVRDILALPRIREQLDRLRLSKSHALISVDAVLSDLKPRLDEFETELSTLEKKHVKQTGADPIRDELSAIIGGNVGTPYSAHDLMKLYAEGEKRYDQRIPPGYADANDKGKQPDFFYGGATYRPKFGDLIIWHQILDHARTKQLKLVMFVTDEMKPDWRYSTGHRGDKMLLPIPELVEEIHRESGVEVFYIYSSEIFLTYAKDRLGVTISESTIPQVTDAKEAARAIAAEAEEYVPSLIQVTGAVGNRRDALLYCGYCGQANIPFHFYEGDGTPRLHEVLGVFHYWDCPAVMGRGTVRVMVLWPEREPEILTVEMPR
jgi:hypothetical protein